MTSLEPGFGIDPDGEYTPWAVASDPTNHVAADLGYEESGPPQLGSYTVDAKGNISTTNIAEDMPYTKVAPLVLNMSPSGKLLAVAGNNPSLGEGLEVYHFNGAAPIAPYSGVLTAAPIDLIRWDNSNHLYALSESTNQLFVYTVTPTSISPVVGSPFAVSSPNALIVVPK